MCFWHSAAKFQELKQTFFAHQLCSDTKILSGCRMEGEKVLSFGWGRLIDFLDIGLSLALEVLFPLGSDYLCAV